MQFSARQFPKRQSGSGEYQLGRIDRGFWWDRWANDRRKLEEELRKARDEELDEVLRQVEAEKPEVAKKIRKKAKPSPESSTDYEAIRQRFSAKLAKIIVEIQVQPDDSVRLAREAEEDDALFLLLLD